MYATKTERGVCAHICVEQRKYFLQEACQKPQALRGSLTSSKSLLLNKCISREVRMHYNTMYCSNTTAVLVVFGYMHTAVVP